MARRTSTFARRLRATIVDSLPTADDDLGLRAESDALLAHIDAYLARAARLLRPRMVFEAARAFGGAPRETVCRLAVATELLHIFALMHDDAIDGDTPRGASTITGLLAGDLLHAVGWAELASAAREAAIDGAVLDLIRSTATITIVGQVAEQAWDAPSDVAALYRLYDAKTGQYSFVAPLTIGAWAARPTALSDGDRTALAAVGRSLGRAWQLADDLADDAEDRRAGRETPLRRVWRAAGAAGTAEISTWVADRIDECLKEAESAASCLSLPQTMRRDLLTVAESLIRDRLAITDSETVSSGV